MTLETLGYKKRFLTTLFGKEYYWITDPYGTWFLERVQ